MKRTYKIYGMHIQSEIEIEEAILAKDQNVEPDIVVECGVMPDFILDHLKDSDPSQHKMISSADSLFFRIGNVASYNIEKNKVTVDIMPEAVHSEVKCFLLGSALGYCMALRGKIAIHGGGIAKYGKGVIVTGESGAGKSTVCDSLRDIGYEFISDDVCAISENGESMHIDMAYPQQKLCRDAALRKGYDLSELIYINESRDKFAVRLKEAYLPDGEDFKFLFEIMLTDDEELTFTKIEGHEKLFLILRNIYRGEGSMNMWGMPPTAMKVCAKIAETTTIYQIKRPKNKITVEDMYNEIDRIVKEN